MTNERNPRCNPKPGDELFGPVLKVKVLSVVTVTTVTFTTNGKKHPYHEYITNTLTLEEWRKFTNCPEGEA
jgi:hypothetical protein